MSAHRESGSRKFARVKISGLGHGVHQFKLQCMATDFADESVETSRFPLPIFINLTLIKTANEIVAELDLKTTAELSCDRCLNPIAKSIEGFYRLIFLQASQTVFEHKFEDEIRFISKNDTELDFADDIRETLLLSLPMKNVCETECSLNGSAFVHEFRLAKNEPINDSESDWQTKLALLSKQFKNE